MESSAALKKRVNGWYVRLMRASESQAKQAGSWFKAAQSKQLSASQRRELEALGEAWKAWANTLRKHGFSLVQAEYKAPPPPKAKKERKPRAAKKERKSRAKEWVSPTVQAELAEKAAKDAAWEAMVAKNKATIAAGQQAAKKALSKKAAAKLARAEKLVREAEARDAAYELPIAQRGWASPSVEEEAATAAKAAKLTARRARAARAILGATGHTAAARAGQQLAEQVLEGKAPIPKGLKVPRAPKAPSPAAKERKAKAAAKVDDKLKKTAVKRAYHFLDVLEEAAQGHLQKVRLQSLEAMLPSRPRGVAKVAAYEKQGGVFELRGVVEGLFALGSRLFPGNKTLEEAWQSHLRQVVLEFKLPKQYG